MENVYKNNLFICYMYKEWSTLQKFYEFFLRDSNSTQDVGPNVQPSCTLFPNIKPYTEQYGSIAFILYNTFSKGFQYTNKQIIKPFKIPF